MSAEAERWREVLHADEDVLLFDDMVEAGNALTAALEAAEVEKAHLTKVATEYQSRIAELEAGLREIAPVLDAAADQAASLNEAGMSADLDAAYRIARERLGNP